MAEPAVPADAAQPSGGDGPPEALDIQQELGFQERSLRVQHVGWVVMTGVVLAAVLGVFGHGPLSGASGEDGALEVSWSRFVRHRADTVVTVQVDPSALRGGEVEVRVSRAWVEGVQVEQVNPEPVAVAGDPEWTTFRFEAPAGDAPLEVALTVLPDDLWSREARISVPGAGEVRLSQFVWP